MACQPTLFELEPGPLVQESVRELAFAARRDRGAVYTHRKVVDFILDLMGYTSDFPLYESRILEPCFGMGDFLFPIIERLLTSWQNSNSSEKVLENAVLAVELNKETFEITREKMIQRLNDRGISQSRSLHLADKWLLQGDFLLEPIRNDFSFIAGNPPYLRQERIPEPLLTEYRRRYKSIYDRADIYVPFIERALSLLTDHGTLGFICADRWMKNRYGGPLRRIVSENYRLKTYVDMVETEAFQTNVATYPAITIITRDNPGPTRTVYRPRLDEQSLTQIVADINAPTLPKKTSVQELQVTALNDDPWLLKSPERVALLRRIEKEYPTLEEAGGQISIGVATGADKVFIADYASLDVEPDRKLPLVTTSDIGTGTIRWQGLGVVNPFNDTGNLVDLCDYPRLARYLNKHREVIANRHCARKNPDKWFRTIDRIHEDLTTKPKLLIPDIKGSAHIVYDKGEFYPHHNLYYIVSNDWDLRALQAVLRSRITCFFVETYSTQIRGGYLRFQAQYLRRIRIPFWKDVPEALRKKLVLAADSRDCKMCDLCAYELYQLTNDEISAIDLIGEEQND